MTMPSNKVEINGSEELTFDVSDSFMPVLMKWIEYATKTPEEGSQRNSMMGSLVNSMIQERYGPDMKWTDFTVRHYEDEQCYVIEVDLAEQEAIHPALNLDP
jgi:hypothetical protein